MTQHNQNFLQLASIQAASSGIPAVLIGNHLAKTIGAGSAIASILIANLILWMIGMTIVSMASSERVNAIENTKRYLGKYGGLAAAVVMMLAFTSWFVFQFHYFTDTYKQIAPFNTPLDTGSILRIGAGFGMFCSLVAMGGIRLLKWYAVALLPILLLYHLSAIYSSHKSVEFTVWMPSFSGVVSTMLLLLPGFVNLPTFFRHSHSREDSYLALILMTFITSFFEISSIWMNISLDSLPPSLHSPFINGFTICIIILATLSCNLLNIYFASACLEIFIPQFDSVKGYAIIGMLGTSAYTFIQITKTIEFLVDLTNAFIAILGVVLLISFLIKLIVNHRPRILEKTINGIAWLIGCLTSLALQINSPDLGTKALLGGVSATILFYILVIFIEETHWAWKHLYPSKSAE